MAENVYSFDRVRGRNAVFADTWAWARVETCARSHGRAWATAAADAGRALASKQAASLPLLRYVEAMTRARALLLLAAVTCVTTPRPVLADDWMPISSVRGVTIYRRELPGSHLTAMKGTGTIEAPVWKVASILLDTQRAREWVDSLKESRVLRRLAPDRYIEYNHVGGPLLMKDRDFVSEVHITVDPRTSTFDLAYQPASDPDAPTTHNVRGELLSGRFEATSVDPDKRTTLTVELQIDPKGFIPAWIINFFQKSWPLHTFDAIRAQAAKPDIAMPEAFIDVLTPTRPF
jgi:hypothetical protein